MANLGIYLYNNEQIKYIHDSCKIASKALYEISKIIDIGITTYEIDKFAEDYIYKCGAKPAFLGYNGFPSSVCTSINEVVVHGIPKKTKKLKKGTIISIDIGVLYNDYFGDTARTFQVGNVSNEVKQLLNVTETSLAKGINSTIIGNRISDISYAIETYVKKFGYSPVKDLVGHGIGKNLHEQPSIPNFIDKTRGPKIMNGMVLAIEPMINIGTHEVELDNDGWSVLTKDRMLSAHFEHTVAVIDNKPSILTKSKLDK